MIGYIKGVVIDKSEKNLTLLTGGLGYKVSCLFESIEKARNQEEIEFWTHDHIREDARELYGFETRDERDFFSLLLTISGIGPKTALNILNIASIDALKKAAVTGDTSHLVKVSGIGKKNAEKIVLELKGKFKESENSGEHLKHEVEAIEALKALGYNHKDARNALQEIPQGMNSTEERIKAALKLLAK